ncbi:MAG: VWA domain-containing protein, partial [Victivallales bacterium]|nr:VWA domain-containing protein [Victivallales bacterium]
TVFFAVDLSASGLYGAGQTSKNDLAAELCATLAFSAVKNNDKIGLLLFTDRTELFIPPVKGNTSAMRLIREVLGFRPQGTGTDLAGALNFLARVLKKRAVVFLISDFIGGGDYDQPLQMLARRHDVVALQLNDASEQFLPNAGLIEMQDAETGESILVDTSSRAVRDAFALNTARRQTLLTSRLQRLGVDQLALTTGMDFIRDLSSFLQRRTRRK